jgi:mono/diheme cytochrome c family protein
MSIWRNAACAIALLALAGLSACAPDTPRARSVVALQGDAARGGALYERTCSQCHHDEKYWWVVIALYGASGVVSTVINGVPNTKMPAFADMTDQQLADLYAYLRQSRR